MTIDEMNKEDFDIIRHLDTIKSRKLCTVEMPLCMPLNNKHQWKSYSKVHAMQQLLFFQIFFQKFFPKKKKSNCCIACTLLYDFNWYLFYLFFLKKLYDFQCLSYQFFTKMPLWMKKEIVALHVLYCTFSIGVYLFFQKKK